MSEEFATFNPISDASQVPLQFTANPVLSAAAELTTGSLRRILIRKEYTASFVFDVVYTVPLGKVALVYWASLNTYASANYINTKIRVGESGSYIFDILTTFTDRWAGWAPESKDLYFNPQYPLILYYGNTIDIMNTVGAAAACDVRVNILIYEVDKDYYKTLLKIT